jgi:DNA-binding NtrC family response regulator
LRDDAIEALKAYAWPGNVRELKNVIERGALLFGEGALTAESLNLVAVPRATAPVAAEGGVGTLAGAERTMIAAALKETGGNTSEAARRLGVTRMALRYRMEKYGIRAADFA